MHDSVQHRELIAATYLPSSRRATDDMRQGRHATGKVRLPSSGNAQSTDDEHRQPHRVAQLWRRLSRRHAHASSMS